MKYAIRINDKITGNIIFEGYFVVNSSNMLTGFYETINGFTDYTQNLIIPTDNLPSGIVDNQGFQTYIYNNDQNSYFNNIYLPSWKQFNYSGILIKYMNNYKLNVSYINIFDYSFSNDPSIMNESNVFVTFNDNTQSTNLVFINITPVIEPTPRPRMTMGSLYTNNAQVYYKSHTLAPGGIGGVRNYRLKSRKT
jgi:hypothetical protein